VANPFGAESSAESHLHMFKEEAKRQTQSGKLKDTSLAYDTSLVRSPGHYKSLQEKTIDVGADFRRRRLRRSTARLAQIAL